MWVFILGNFVKFSFFSDSVPLPFTDVVKFGIEAVPAPESSK